MICKLMVNNPQTNLDSILASIAPPSGMDDETSKKLFQLVETYIKIDKDLTIKILNTIRRITSRKTNNNLSTILNAYLKEEVVKKLTEYVKKNKGFAEKLADSIGEISANSGEKSDEIIGMVIDNIGFYYSVNPKLASYILQLVELNPRKIAYVLFNKFIIAGLLKLRSNYSKNIAEELAYSIEHEKISERDIESIASFMNKYGNVFPELVKTILYFYSWNAHSRKTIIELLISDKDLENILKNEYSKYPPSIRGLVAGIIKNAPEYGYIDKLKPLLNDQNFKRILIAHRYISIELTELGRIIKNVMTYNKWNTALRRLANVINMYDRNRLYYIFSILKDIEGEDKTLKALYVLEKHAPNLRAAISEMCIRSLFKREQDYRCKDLSNIS